MQPVATAGRQRHSAALVGSKKLYIFGGFDGNKWLSDLYVLDVGPNSAMLSAVVQLRSLVHFPSESVVSIRKESVPPSGWRRSRQVRAERRFFKHGPVLRLFSANCFSECHDALLMHFWSTWRKLVAARSEALG